MWPFDDCLRLVWRFHTPHTCRFDNGSEHAEPVTAGQVYRWLLRAKVPLEFEMGNVFWDGVKRFLFTPCCLFYGVLPVVAAGWAASSCSAAPMLHQLLLSALLIIPNIATAFVFQSFMISVAAIVRRKLHAMKALSHMLSPVRLTQIVVRPAMWRVQCPAVRPLQLLQAFVESFESVLRCGCAHVCVL